MAGNRYKVYALFSSVSVTAEVPQATMTMATTGDGWMGGLVCAICVRVPLFERHQDLPMKSQRIYISGGTTQRRRVRQAEPGGRVRTSTLSTWCGDAVAVAAAAGV